jgi:hypothetical protein
LPRCFQSGHKEKTFSANQASFSKDEFYFSQTAQLSGIAYIWAL